MINEGTYGTVFGGAGKRVCPGGLFKFGDPNGVLGIDEFENPDGIDALSASDDEKVDEGDENSYSPYPPDSSCISILL